MKGRRLVEVRSEEDLPAAVEVMDGVEVALSKAEHDAAEGLLILPFEVTWGPSEGRWLLVADGVTGMQIEREGTVERDTFRGLEWDRKAGRLVIRSVLSRILLDVDRLSLVLRRTDTGHDHPEIHYDALPADTRDAIATLKAARYLEHQALVAARRRATWYGAAWMAAVAGAAAALVSHSPVIYLLVVPAIMGSTLLFCVTFGIGARRSLLFFFPAGALSALLAGGVFAAIGGAVMFGALGVVFMIWMEDRFSLLR